MTREARAASERLPDRISLGVLGRTFTDELLDEVIDAAQAREQRYRLLPARLVLLFTLACWLFMRSGYPGVISKLADAHAVQEPGWGRWTVPTTAAITKARARLGPAPLRLLFAKVAGPAGTPDTPGVFYAGLRVATVDGFTLDLQDTGENAQFFGRGANGSASGNPYPQLRALALAESGTRSLLAAAYGPCTRGEQSLAVDLLPALGPGMLLLADRNFLSWNLWTKATATGADLCWRASASFKLEPLTVLADGTYLTQLAPPRKTGGDPVTVRVVEYTVTTTDTAGGKDDVSEVFALVTTMVDPAQAPAGDLAGLYQQRWQAETGIADLKTTQRGGPDAVLRSKKPAMVEQEFWAMLCVYQGIREVISYATPAGLDPGRISFMKAIDAARDMVTRAALPPAGQARALTHLTAQLTAKATWSADGQGAAHHEPANAAAPTDTPDTSTAPQPSAPSPTPSHSTGSHPTPVLNSWALRRGRIPVHVNLDQVDHLKRPPCHRLLPHLVG
ncbi:MAG: IS4 family transposase [Dermatophilaceae bacterium]